MGFICGLIVGMLLGGLVIGAICSPSAKDAEILLTYYEEENRRENGSC